MKTTIFYYSGTGNSLKIAKDISAKLENSEIIPIAKLWEQNKIVPQSEKIGFIFPLYFMGCPSIILEFLNKLEVDKVNYIFAVVTSHHGSSGATLYQINKILRKKSKALNAGFSIRMPGNYIPMYDIASKESHKRDFDQAKDFDQECDQDQFAEPPLYSTIELTFDFCIIFITGQSKRKPPRHSKTLTKIKTLTKTLTKFVTKTNDPKNLTLNLVSLHSIFVSFS